ncbi:MAG: beta-lactamase family protein [Saprospiraceae bacterium]|nr:beta-lactamase family protein [Pyrinomonadaceae bacterium]
MNKFSRAVLSSLLALSLFTVSLPNAVYAQTAAPAAASGQYQKELAVIEEKTEARRKELGIPGMSLVIVKDDQIIYLKGLGFKDFEKKIAVTPDSQFAIGSATKAFTALSVLMTQDEGKLTLDDNPKKLLPYFKMYDSDADKNITIRDLLSHSSGLNRTDLAMITGKLNRAELIQVSAQAKPTAKLREKFQYQNIMFTAAGEIVAKAQGQPWEKFVPERIFAPLGMKNSTMSMKQMEKTKDHSFGYSYNFDTKETRKLPFRDIDEVAPAGSINSSARDMAQWLRLVLNAGTVDGKRLVSEKGFEEWLKPQTKIGGTSSYGLGWFLQTWNGMKVIQHGGNIDGFNSMVAMIPEKKLGFVMLTNVSGSPLGNELMPIVWENILGVEKPSDAIRLPVKTMQFMAGKYRLEAAKMDIEIKIEKEDLVMTVPGQPQYTLERTGPRQFKLLGAPEGFAVKFTPEQGDATEMFLQQPQGNYTLPRIRSDGAVEAKAVGGAKGLIGRYESEANGKTVEVKDLEGKISLMIDGQPPYALGEKTKDVYSLSPLPDSYWLTVKRGADGKIEKFTVTQPEGEFGFRSLAGVETKVTMTVDELMKKSIEAAGGEANWRKLNTRVSTFSLDLENQGVQGFGTSYSKAPNKTCTEMTITALGKTIATGFEFFDGANGEELYSFAPADKYTGKRLEDIRLAADFYAPLDWTANYKKIEISSIGKAGGEEAYVVTFEPEKGSKFTEYYSTKTFLLLKREGTIPSSTSSISIPYNTTFSDYREIDGIKLAFKTVNYTSGNGSVVTVLKDVKHNVAIVDSVFAARKK